MLVTGDMPIAWGREVWGEVKKAGTIGYFPTNASVFAYGERQGMRLVEIEAQLTGEAEVTPSGGRAFEIKAYPAADGVGLQYDPLLVTFIDSPPRAFGRPPPRSASRDRVRPTRHDADRTHPLGRGDHRRADLPGHRRDFPA